MSRQFLLDEEVVFLNHGSFGACPRPVFESYQNWQLQLERQPVAFLDPDRGLTIRMRETRAAVAAELGTSAGNLVDVTNATMGLNIIARSLDLKAGDEILTTDHEYAALEKTWDFVCQRTGAEVRVVEVPLPLNSEAAFTDAILSGMTDRTRVLFLSHITSPTALVFPIENVVEEARQRGIWTVIDGAHTLGHIPLSLEEMGVDFYVGNCHKWLMAPKGSAFLYARPEMQALIDPLTISHGWTVDSKVPGAIGPFGNSAFVDSFEVQGTRDPAAWLAVSDAIDFRAKHNWQEVSAQCHVLAQETANRLGALTGLPALSDPLFCAPQMVAMPIPECDPLQLHDDLLVKYNIEIPVFVWQDRYIARLSVQGYNDRTQMDILVDALSRLLDLQPSGQLVSLSDR